MKRTLTEKYITYINMEKRIILAPNSANKWQEPCPDLPAILDIISCAIYGMCFMYGDICCTKMWLSAGQIWAVFTGASFRSTTLWLVGVDHVKKRPVHHFPFWTQAQNFVQSNGVNNPSIKNYGSVWRDSKSANSHRQRMWDICLFLARDKSGSFWALYRLLISKHGWLTLRGRDFFR